MRARQRLGCVCAAAALHFASFAWGATGPHPNTVPPWAKCYLYAETKPTCDTSSWTTSEDLVERVSYLFVFQQYKALDYLLQDIVTANRRLQDGEHAANAAYWTFRGVLWGEQAKFAAEWQAAVPDSAFAPIARARVAYDAAWRARGSGYGNTVSKESWELFNIRLNEARQILLDAPRAARENPMWHHMLLVVTQDTPQRAEADRIFQEATARWPGYNDFYHVFLTRMLPRWGGSRETVDRLIRDWSARRAKEEGESMYARLYSELHTMEAPGDTLMDWKRMKASFEELVRRYPIPKWKNRYASHACTLRDKDAFASAMKTLPTADIRKEFWLRGNPYEACLRWAAI